MSSTNKTTHYDLSQYTASDKPTYLVDYNSDMSAIDTGIYNAQTTATTNATAIGTLSNLNTTEKTNLVGAINEVNTQVGTNTGNIGTLQTSVSANTGNIGTMANLDTTDKTSLVNAINEIINKFNFSYKQNLSITTSSANVVVNNAKVSSAYNSDGSVGKIYGWFDLDNTNGSGHEAVTVTIADTGLRPSTAITINGILFEAYERPSTNNNNAYSHVKSFTLNTDGTVTFDTDVWYDEESAWSFVACLIFATDFGDTPIPPTV